MTYIVQAIPALKCIEVAHGGGLVTRKQVEQARQEFIELSRKTGLIDALMDGSKMSFIESLVEVAHSAEVFSRAELSRKSRFAVVFPKSALARRGAVLYIDSCIRHGWEARGFDCRDEAVDWLRSSSRHDHAAGVVE